MWVTTIEWLQRFASHKFHMTDGQNMHDHITSDRRSKRTWSHCVMGIPFILSGSPNECWLHTCNSCVITTWTLGLQAPLVAQKKFMSQRRWPKHKHKKNTRFWYPCVYAYAYMSKPSSLMQKLLLLMDHGPCYAYAYTCVAIEDHAMLICLYLSPKVMIRL